MIFNSLGSNYNFTFALKALFSGGGKTDFLELEKYLSEKYSGTTVLLYKGREAIALALKLVNLPKGSNVAINGYTCYAVYQPIVEAGLRPEYLDVAENSLHFSARELSVAVEKNPQIKVVIIQNTLGYPCDIEGIAEVCKQKNLVLIEDLAHSVGCVYKNGREAGGFGDFVVLSFGQDKIVDAVSGGALIIKNKQYQSYTENNFSEISYGQKSKDRWYSYYTWRIRATYRSGIGKLDHFILKKLDLLSKPMGANEKIVLHKLPGWYAKLALFRFKNLTDEIEHRKNIAKIYFENLNKQLLLPNLDISKSTNLRFPILVNNREELITHLKTLGIHVSDIWYDAPIAPKKYMTHTNYAHECPRSEKMSEMVLNLPTHINVSEKQAREIVEEINKWAGDSHSTVSSRPSASESRDPGSRTEWIPDIFHSPEKFRNDRGLLVKTIYDKKIWEEFLAVHSEANFLQSWYWGEFHEALRNKIHRAGFYNGDVLVGVMLSVVEDAKRGRYLTVPAGPIIDWHDQNLVSAFIGEIKKIAQEEKCVFVRVRPQLESNEFSKDLFKKSGFVSAPIHLHAELTSQLDLSPTEDQLLANMRKATRYEIKKGITTGIKVTSSANPDDIKKFYDIQIATSERQKFVPFSYKFFYEQFKVFASSNNALLYSAELDGKLLAQGFIIFYGKEAAYHYGASTDEGRKYSGAYLIQWEAIKEAKRRGMQRYNFWGVTHEDEKTHRFYRLSIFKRGFGGSDLEYLHAQDLVIKKAKYLLNWGVEMLRKKIRRV